MYHIKMKLALLLACFLLIACYDDEVAGNMPANVRVVNVDVVIPAKMQSSMQESIDWALENIAKAQQRQQRQVKLNLRYHDEDTENLEALGYALTHPKAGADTCHAIIGPFHSTHARSLLNYAAASRLPVIMPACTSGELQRIEARSPNSWFLLESDISQCDVLMSMSRMVNPDRVALIYTADDYGRTFYDWYNYYATEYGAAIAPDGLKAYRKGDDLTAYLQELREQGGTTYLSLALSDSEDYLQVLEQVGNPFDATTGSTLYTVCTDAAMSKEFSESDYHTCGLLPVADPATGFAATFESRFQHIPYLYEAHIYDALCLIALGAAKRMWAPDANELMLDGKPVSYDSQPYGPTLTDWMRAAVADEEGPNTGWTAAGLATAFDAYAQGRHCALIGALGNWIFDADTHTSMLQSYYGFWKKEGRQLQMLSYMTVSETGKPGLGSSLKFAWEMDKITQQSFDPTLTVDHHLPPVTDHWAVVISPSTTWANYRHQADAFAVYQMLRQHGYDDEHIILICEDNLAETEKNAAHRGEIFVNIGGDDVRRNAKVDYHFSDLTRNDLCDILLGRASARLPHVVHSTASSNVFFFWSGHGGEGEGPLWGDETARYAFGTERLQQAVEQMHAERRYRRLMLAIETCFSGLWGQAIVGIPDVIAITAANAYEPSKADVHDRELGVFLSNAFARSFRDAINANPSIELNEIYRRLARTTTGSHVSLYNVENYGSVYETYMSDYMPSVQ